MKTRIRLISAFVVIGIATQTQSLVAFAEARDAVNSVLPENPQKLEELITSEVKKKIARGTFFVLGIEEKIAATRDELSLLKDNIDTLENKVEEAKFNVESLHDQLANLDRLSHRNKEKIKIATLQIASYENQISLLNREVETKERELKENVASLDSVLTTYYLHTNAFFDPGAGESGQLLALLANDQSTGEILKQQEYLGAFKNMSEHLAEKIVMDNLKLDDAARELESKTTKIEALQAILNREQQALESLAEAKKRLLEETEGKQLIYETLLELSRKEIEQVSAQILRLQENYDFFQQKLDELKENPEDFTFPSEDRFSLESGGSSGTSLLKGDAVLAWPVSPSGGLSALFHDSAYEKALGVRHNAIDIRVVQGSKAKSAADGVISKVVDNGFGYSYVIIAHADKVLTLYGHMSDIFVSEGEVVRQGQTIGLSGGIPGTKGAGWLTTGAHLHFEVFKDFKHVDPLEYLPLEFVPVSSLPEKYLQRLSSGL